MGEEKRRPFWIVSELVTLAHGRSPEQFARALGSPIALLVGPSAKLTREGAFSYVTRATTPAARFSAPAEFASHEVYLVRKASIFARKKGMFIGRAASNDVVIDDDSISKIHARIETLPEREGLLVEDRSSRNGTMVRGALILPGQLHKVAFGEVVQLGSRVFKVYEAERLHKTLRYMVPAVG